MECDDAISSRWLCEATGEHRIDADISAPTLFRPASVKNAINVEKDDFHGSFSANRAQPDGDCQSSIYQPRRLIMTEAAFRSGHRRDAWR
jgi:hypothetical protein